MSLTHIVLKDITNNKILYETQKDYININDSFKVNTHTAVVQYTRKNLRKNSPLVFFKP